MPRKLQLGLIGTGLAPRHLYLPAFDALRHRIDLVACTNRTRAKAEEYAADAGIPVVHDTVDELLADPAVEAVMVSLPIATAPQYVLAALRAGKAVMTEKPNAANTAAAKRLLTSAARYDAPYLVGENYAFMSHAHQLARWVAQGRLGDLRTVEVRDVTVMDQGQPWFHTSWRHQPAHVGGFVVDAGVHLAHVLREAVGDPVEVRGLQALQEPALSPVDTIAVAMRFESGALGTWSSCFSAPLDGPKIRITGTKGVASWTPTEAELVSRRGAVTRSEPKEDSFTGQFRHFADVVVSGVEPQVTPADTLGDLALMERLVKGR
jgi:predicted dehydrogenase